MTDPEKFGYDFECGRVRFRLKLALMMSFFLLLSLTAVSIIVNIVLSAATHAK